MIRAIAQIVLTFLIAAAICMIIIVTGDYWINTTSSLPYGLYQKDKTLRSLQKGDLVLACMPDSLAELALERGYVAKGKCKNGTVPVGKHIAATFGDTVSIDEHGVTVNNILLENSSPAKADELGRSLKAAEINKILSRDEFLLLNLKDNSFDGRYFGISHYQDIIGRIKPVLTFN